MEMLDVNTIISGVALAFLGWIAVSVVDLKTETAVIKEKVAANHMMIKPIWEEFILERSDGNLAWLDETTDR